jgi:hypothetical protein
MRESIASRYLFQMGAIGAVSYWGFSLGDGALAVVYSIAAALLVAVAWEMLIGPRSKLSTPPWVRELLAVIVITLSALALASAGEPELAVGFLAAALISSLLQRLTRRVERE